MDINTFNSWPDVDEFLPLCHMINDDEIDASVVRKEDDEVQKHDGRMYLKTKLKMYKNDVQEDANYP